MLERLLIPSWNTPDRSLDDWQAALERLGHRPSVIPGATEETWLAVDPLGLRMLAMVEGLRLTAIHAEIAGTDPSPALALLDRAAEDFGWEVHDEDDEEE